MPSGIVLASSSHGATQEAIEEVFKKHGMEPDKPPAAEPEAPVEPKREDFESDEAFETAQEEHEAKLDELEAAATEKAEKEEEERQRKQEERHPRLSRRERAVQKATRALEEKNRQLEERLATLEGGKKPAAEVAQPKIEVPKREDFKSDAEFDEAMFDYRYEVRRAKEEAVAAQRAERQRLEDNFSTYKDSVGDFKAEHDDWDQVVGTKVALSEPLYFSIIELREDGPQVTYYLAKHPEELARINRLSHHSAAMEVARLSDRLKTGNRASRRAASGASGGTPQKPKPRLPEPVKPVSSAAVASTVTSAEAAKNRDYRAFKAAQRAGR